MVYNRLKKYFCVLDSDEGEMLYSLCSGCFIIFFLFWVFKEIIVSYVGWVNFNMVVVIFECF